MRFIIFFCSNALQPWLQLVIGSWKMVEFLIGNPGDYQLFGRLTKEAKEK